MMQRLTDLYSDTYYRFKRAIFISVGAVLLGVLVFAYLSNVQIDGGTEHAYQTLDVLFYVFCTCRGGGRILCLCLPRKTQTLASAFFQEQAQYPRAHL